MSSRKPGATAGAKLEKGLSQVSEGCQELWAERTFGCEQWVRGLPHSPSQKIRVRVE